MSHPWDQLVAGAVLGTDRVPPRIDGSPVVTPLLKAIDAADAEPARRLLHSAAVLQAFQRAATQPIAPGKREAGERCPADERPEAPTRTLRELLTTGQAELLPEWAAAVRSRGLRVPAEWLPALFGHADVLEPGLLKAIAGVRGRWLQSQNPAWRPVEAASWDTGSREERLTLLKTLRRTAPARARELVQSTWAEDGHEEKKAFLEVFETGLSMDDEPFLEETALDDRRKPVRLAAAGLLARVEGSRLCARMRERALAAITVRKGMLRKARLETALPRRHDEALGRDGIPKKPPVQMGVRQFWLYEVMARTPLGTWTQTFGKSAEEVVELSRGHELGEILLKGWLRAARGYRNSTWGEALAVRIFEEMHSADEDRWQSSDLCAALECIQDPARRNALLTTFLRKTALAVRPHVAEALLSPHAFSPALSAAVLKALPRWLADHYWIPNWQRLARNVSPELAPKIPESAPDEFTHLVRLRHEIQKELGS